MCKKLVSSILLIIIYLFSANAQNNNGVPFIKNYTTKEYTSDPNNWSIVQDKRGVIYFGNARGVLCYDGVNWEIISTKNKSVVRSLAIDSSGTIYVGAVGEFGYLKTNSNGKLEYQSLINLISENERDFADVWKTYATPQGIYFQTFTKIFRLNNNSIKIWKPTTSFHLSFYVNNNFYVIEREHGLKILNNDKFNLVKDGDYFSSYRIYGMFSYRNNSILIACREKGIIIYNEKTENKFTSLNNTLNNELINAQIYSGILLPNNEYCIGTLKNGVFFIDCNGNIQTHLNKNNGLLDDDVKFLSLDNQNDLWLALGNGISRVEISSPLRLYTQNQGLKGSIEDLIIYKNTLYVATSSGIFFLREGNFFQIKNISSSTWSFEIINQNDDSLLLAGTESGLYKIDNENIELIKEGFIYKIYKSKKFPYLIFVGLNDGISSLSYEKNNWIENNYINGIDADIRNIDEDKNGNLWFSSSIKGLYSLQLDNYIKENFSDKIKIIKYDSLLNLHDLKGIIPHFYNDKMNFATMNGLYEFNEKERRIVKSNLLKDDIDSNQIFRIASLNKNNLYLFKVIDNLDYVFGIANLNNSKLSLYTKPFKRISETEVHSILPTNNILWLGGPDGLIRYESTRNKNYNQKFNALIRSVKAGNKEIFNGNFFESDSTKFTINQPESFVPVLNFSDNSMHFEYAAASYSNEKKNMYSIFLEGFDNGWSDWSTKFEKEYTNLKEGKYVFHVKAKNVYDTISSESTYAFEILPPWYRHTLAYVVYVILFFSVLFGFNAIRTRQLQQRQIKLQEKIEEATAEIKEQKHLIEEKHKEITDSINYAERIQRSFMATKKHLDEHLNKSVTSSEVEKSTSSVNDFGQPDNNTDNYFIFFKPKDVVSGDFYWSATLNNGNFALVTADSTGHGVPGAIMSLLNITSLEKAIENSTAPSEILNHTRNIIIDRLKKDGSEDGGKDGMDCSLCVYDFKNRKLVLSAANNPVWIVRHADTSSEVEKSTDAGLDSDPPRTQVIEIKPDKMPVGKHDRQDQSFTEKEIDLHPGDIIYTLTDGFPDQFGGEKGKKFMSKNLREHLLSISHLPMSEQRKNLEKTFNEWVGNLEQVDDVTVIGIKV